MSEASSKELAKTWPYTRSTSFVEALREAAGKWFKKRSKDTHGKMKYCLATHKMWAENIICREVEYYIRDEQKKNRGESPFILHKYVHHGLSSQAMAFNLLGPLIVRKDFAPLEAALAKIGIKWAEGKETKARFEYEDRGVFNEDVGQPTSIDLYLEGEGGRLFIEAKLSEKEFGGCSIFAGGDCEGRNPYPNRLDSCYLHHTGRKYWDELLQPEFSDVSLLNGPICPFACYYQFFREVLFALHHDDGTFILLHDDRNPAFLRKDSDGVVQGGLWPFLYEAIPHSLRHRVGRLSIQDLVAEIEKSPKHKDWIGEFKEKYGLK
ncbi:MAG: hypothetical protein IKJ34_04400 [Mailhella sp.]|nr:hypothetical protein [Mailhella sp.]